MDVIYRQDAVREIANHLGIPAENWMKIAEEWLRDVPSAQPTQNNTSNALKSLDCISRQDAIKAAECIVDHHTITPYKTMRSAMDHLQRILRGMPSAEPEISLHESCTDCPLYDKDRHSCPRFNKVIPETLREVMEERRQE